MQLVVEAAQDKKAEELTVLDLRGRCDFTDYFVICEGASTRQVISICEGIEERLSKDLKRSPGHLEGKKLGEWVLLDYIDFVVHVFTREKRAFFGLERLWGDAPRLIVESAAGAKAPRPRSSGGSSRR